MKKPLALLAPIAVAMFAAVVFLVPSPDVDASCFFRQDTGVMCNTECTNMGGGLTCFDESVGRCCYESENACGDTIACSICDGPGCQIGDF